MKILRKSNGVKRHRKKLEDKKIHRKKESENLVGPEYPGEGAINNILIAGSTDI